MRELLELQIRYVLCFNIHGYIRSDDEFGSATSAVFSQHAPTAIGNPHVDTESPTTVTKSSRISEKVSNRGDGNWNIQSGSGCDTSFSYDLDNKDIWDWCCVYGFDTEVYWNFDIDGSRGEFKVR